MSTTALDIAIGTLLALIVGRILGADDIRGMLAAYVMMAATAAVVPVFLGAVWLGLKSPPR